MKERFDNESESDYDVLKEMTKRHMLEAADWLEEKLEEMGVEDETEREMYSSNFKIKMEGRMEKEKEGIDPQRMAEEELEEIRKNHEET